MLEAMTHFNLDAFTHLFSADEVVGPSAGRACRSPMCWSAKTATGWRCTCLHPRSSGKDWPAPWSGRTFLKTRALPPARRALTTKRRMIEVLSAIFKTRKRVSGATAWWPKTCRTRPCTPRPRCPKTRRSSTCSCLWMRLRPVPNTTFKTVRSPVSYDGERSLEVTAPPLLGQHNADFARGWPARTDFLNTPAANESKA
jgi:hypothetical protein